MTYKRNRITKPIKAIATKKRDRRIIQMMISKSHKLASDLYLKEYGMPAEANMFGRVISLIEQNRDLRTKKHKNSATLLTTITLNALAKAYFKGRKPKKPSLSDSIDDEAVFLVMESYFKTDSRKRKLISEIHKKAMGAENAVGFYLEYYIASVLEKYGWTWCAGSIVDKVDFFKIRHNGVPILIQIKSRDNTENSSSMKVREGTPILKWYRLESKTGRTCWEDFPDKQAKDNLSEKGFQRATKDLLEVLSV